MINPARPGLALPLQVAAICYRWHKGEPQFLLVQTSGSRRKWTFPKGDLSQRLSDAESASREAHEEAGAIGAVERRHFHHYLHAKSSASQKNGIQEYLVRAFLLEVRRTSAPREFLRKPTWFSSDDARRALAQGRKAKYGDELASVIDRALLRLKAVRSSAASAR